MIVNCGGLFGIRTRPRSGCRVPNLQPVNAQNIHYILCINLRLCLCVSSSVSNFRCAISSGIPVHHLASDFQTIERIPRKSFLLFAE